MKVEFLTDEELGDGRQIIISASEFLKADKDDEEFKSLAFATECLFSWYGGDTYLYGREYEAIKKMLNKNGFVIITAKKNPRSPQTLPDIYPEVYVLNDGRLKHVDISSRD